jgi:hypothetical protein
MAGLLILKQLENLSIFLSKTTKKLGLFYQKLVYLSMFFVGFIVINQVVGLLSRQWQTLKTHQANGRFAFRKPL